MLFKTIEICSKLGDGLLITFFGGHFEQLTGIRDTDTQRIQGNNDAFELGPLLPKRLRSIRIIPYVRLFELTLDFGQSLRLAIIVKGTPLTHRCVPRGFQFFA